MKPNTKILYLGLFTVAAIASIFFLPPISQDPSFHVFADRNTICGIPNFLNVISNIPFLIIGIIGLNELKRSTAQKSLKIIYAVLFSGILLIGFGSAWYHHAPNNNSLVYDRIPMTIVFMAFLSAVVAECINRKGGMFLLIPLVITGIASVLYWHYSETRGQGDLRWYGLVQFYPMAAIPVILLLFPSSTNRKAWFFLMWVVIWYVIAKLLEHFDAIIYATTGFISGHSLKHLAAAVATWYMIKLFKWRYVKRSSI